MDSKNKTGKINKDQFLSKWLESLKKNSSIQNLNKKAVEDCYNTFVNLIKETLANNDDISLVKFCKIYMTERKEREAKNPKTGETMFIKAKKVPKVKFTNNFIDSL